MADDRRQKAGDRRQETGDRRQALTLPQTWRQALITPSLSQPWEREGVWGWARVFHSVFCILSPVFFFSLLLSCAGPQALKRSLPADTAADLLKIASDDVARLRTFEGEARVSLRLEGARQKGLALVLFRSPDLKVDVTGPLGIRLMTAAASGEHLRIFLPRSNELYEGRADGDALRRVTGVDLGAWAPWQALLGVASADPGRVEGFEREGERLIIRVKEGDGARRLAFDARGLTLAEEEVYDRSGGLVVRRRMWDYRDVDGVVLPRRIVLSQGEDEVRIEYTDWKLNQGVAEERLRMRAPEDVIRVR
jgi:hypothetical protein